MRRKSKTSTLGNELALSERVFGNKVSTVNLPKSRAARPDNQTTSFGDGFV